MLSVQLHIVDGAVMAVGPVMDNGTPAADDATAEGSLTRLVSRGPAIPVGRGLGSRSLGECHLHGRSCQIGRLRPRCDGHVARLGNRVVVPRAALADAHAAIV